MSLTCHPVRPKRDISCYWLHAMVCDPNDARANGHERSGKMPCVSGGKIASTFEFCAAGMIVLTSRVIK